MGLNPDYGTDLSKLRITTTSSYLRVKAERLARADRYEQEAKFCSSILRRQRLLNKAKRERDGYDYTF